MDAETQALLNELTLRAMKSTRSSRAGKVTYIIGNNGTGKSRVLRQLADRLNSLRPARNVACIANSIHDRFNFNDYGRVRYLGARNVGNAVFLSTIGRQVSRLILRAMLIDRRLYRDLCDAVSMNLEFRLSEDVEAEVRKILEVPPERARGPRHKSRVYYELGAAQPLSILRRVASRQGQFGLLTNVQIRMLLRYLELGIDIQIHVRLADGSTLDFGELSTGEQNRMLTFAKVLSAVEDGTVFLIDEPEVSLHLHWQMRFHQTLMDLLAGLDRFHVVVATHAPVLISEAAKSDPENDQNSVVILRHVVDDDESQAEVPPGAGKVAWKSHNFTEIASHDQLVLQYFQSAPYRTKEISVEIADTVLSVAEGTRTRATAEDLLKWMKGIEGVSSDTKEQINKAISLVQQDWTHMLDSESSAA